MPFREIRTVPLTQGRIDGVVAYLSQAKLPLNAKRRDNAETETGGLSGWYDFEAGAGAIFDGLVLGLRRP